MWFLHSLHCFDDCSFYNFYCNSCFNLLQLVFDDDDDDDDDDDSHKK